MRVDMVPDFARHDRDDFMDFTFPWAAVMVDPRPIAHTQRQIAFLPPAHFATLSGTAFSASASRSQSLISRPPGLFL